MLFFLFLLSFHFPLYILPSFTFLHLPSTPVNPGTVVGLKKYEFPHSVNPEESVSQGSGPGGGGCRVLAGPRVSVEPCLVYREPGALRVLGVRAGSQARKEGDEKRGRPTEPNLLLCGEGSRALCRGMLPPQTYRVPSVRFDMATFR